MAWVYILRCADDSFYVGYTNDLEARVEWHNHGHGSNYTAPRLPVRVVYAEQHASMMSAINRERQLKRWTAEKKAALIAGDRDLLKRLSKSRHRKHHPH